MRKSKIRGNNRRLRNFSRWIERVKYLNTEFSGESKHWSASTRIEVLPWINADLDERIPDPHGKIRTAILESLVTIYKNWKELDKSNREYYLKIWLFEPKISQSQVVCAVGSKIEYYKNLFEEAKDQNCQPMVLSNPEFVEFNWKIHDDNEVYLEEEFLHSIENYALEKDYYEVIRLYKRLKSNKIQNTERTYSGQKAFLVKKGNIFVGSSNESLNDLKRRNNIA